VTLTTSLRLYWLAQYPTHPEDGINTTYSTKEPTRTHLEDLGTLVGYASQDESRTEEYRPGAEVNDQELDSGPGNAPLVNLLGDDKLRIYGSAYD
jgi:hypothetical protein